MTLRLGQKVYFSDFKEPGKLRVYKGEVRALEQRGCKIYATVYTKGRLYEVESSNLYISHNLCSQDLQLQLNKLKKTNYKIPEYVKLSSREYAKLQRAVLIANREFYGFMHNPNNRPDIDFIIELESIVKK